MSKKRFFNVVGIDQSKPPGSDCLWFQRDATIVGNSLVKSRPQLPTAPIATSDNEYFATSESIAGTAASFSHIDSSHDSNLWLADGANGYRTPATGEWVSADPGGGDTKVYANIIRSLNGSARVGDNCVFWHRDEDTGHGSSLILWTGGTADPDSSISVDTTSGSNVISVTGTSDDLSGMQLKLSDTQDGRSYTILPRLAGETDYKLDVQMSSTATNALASVNPWGIVGSSGTIWNPTYINDGVTHELSGDASGKLPVAYAAEGHQGRLFISYGNEIRYSGTEDDVDGLYRGIHYWDENSVFSVAPETGNRIERLVSLNNTLFIFKDIGICALRGTVANGDPTKFGANVYTVSDTIVTPTYNSILKTPIGIILISSDDVYLITEDGITSIGAAINPMLYGALVPQSALGRNVGYIDRSFFMDGIAYFKTTYQFFLQQRTNSYAETDPLKYYITFDCRSNTWGMRTFYSQLAPATCSQVSRTSSYESPAWACFNFGNDLTNPRSIFYSGSESSNTYLFLGVATGSSKNYDAPQFSIDTCPIVSESDEPGHVRIIRAYLVASGNLGADTFTIGVYSGEPSVANIYNPSSESSAGTYVDPSTTTTQWIRVPFDSDSYSWSKRIQVRYTDTVAESADRPIIYIHGLCVEYEESLVTP